MPGGRLPRCGDDEADSGSARARLRGGAGRGAGAAGGPPRAGERAARRRRRRLRAPHRRAARLPGGRQQVGLLVRSLPARVPLLPAPLGRASASGSPSSASTPTTPTMPRAPSSRTSRSRIPSYSDPDQEIAATIKATLGFPSTAFYDRSGELVYIKQGGYASEEELAADIAATRSRHASRRHLPVGPRSADNPGVRMRPPRSPCGQRWPPAASRCWSPGRRPPRRTASVRLLARAHRRDLARRPRPGSRPALDEAADEGAEVAIIRLDTPGGLDASPRDIVKDILAAPMPVIVYVSPDGARAASAGRLHHPGRRRRGDGAADQHRLGDADLDRARRRRRGPGPQDHQRRGRLHAGARLGARPQRRPGRADGQRRRERDRRGGAGGRLHRRRSRPPSARCWTQLDGFRVQGPKAQTLEPRAWRSRTTTCRSTTSSCSCWSTRRSPSCCSRSA